MPLATRLENPCAWAGGYNILAQQCAKRASQHVRVLILAMVPVQGGRKGARGQWMMNHCKVAL